MKWALRVSLRLYPRQWRRRYGDELAALLEDTTPGWASLFDLVRGACIMQIRRVPAIPIVATLIGASIGTAVWLNAPVMFASSALVRVQLPGSALEQPESDGARLFRARLARLVPSDTARRATAITLVEPGPESTVVRVSYIGSDATRVRDFVSEVANAVIAPEGLSPGGSILGAATLPTEPEVTSAAPIGIGAGAGLVLGVAVMVAYTRRASAI
jgi:hypothetical protein